MIENPAKDSSPPRSAQPWAQSWEAVIAAAGSDAAQGLDAAQVRRRKAQYGPNRLRQHPRRSAISVLVAQFKSLIVILLLVAAMVGFATGETLAGWAVLIVILINAAIGFFTELRAVRSMEALTALGNVTARVRRAGQVRELPAVELVPGDTVDVRLAAKGERPRARPPTPTVTAARATTPRPTRTRRTDARSLLCAT